MAKKDKKKDKGSSNPADAVRGAVEQAATRFRDTLDELRLPEELRGLRTEIEGLSRRVAALEARAAAPAADDGSSAAEPAPKPRARRTRPARASAGTKPAGRKPAATKRASAGTTRKPATPRRRAKSEDPAPEASAGRS